MTVIVVVVLYVEFEVTVIVDGVGQLLHKPTVVVVVVVEEVFVEVVEAVEVVEVVEVEVVEVVVEVRH